MRALLIPALAMALGMAGPAVASAAPVTDTYLSAVETECVPIYGSEYVIQLGQDVCRTAQKYPKVNATSLAMGEVTSEYEARPYQYAQAKVIVIAALAHLCPGLR